MNQESNFTFTLIVISLVLILLGFSISKLFKRATNNRAYVRTGYGGEIIVQNTGFFVLPILHHVLPINLKTVRLETKLSNETAALTKDHFKVDLTVDFYVSVIAEKEHISQAARSLGDLTLDSDKLQSFLSGYMIQAVRKTASEMTLHEISKQQDSFVQKIQQDIIEDVKKNSLQLESVKLRFVNQTAREYFCEDNAFDAVGLSKLSEIIESEKKSRQQIAQQYLLESKHKELEMDQLMVEIENKKQHLRLDQERELKIFEAANALTVSQDTIKKAVEEQQTKILANQELESSKQSAKISLNVKLREKLKTQIETNLIKAEAAVSEERIKSARKLERADINVQIKLLKNKRKTELEAQQITKIAASKKDAVREQVEAEKIKADGAIDRLRFIENSKIESKKLLEKNFTNRYQKDAEGVKILIDAFSSLTKSKLPTEVYPNLIELFTGMCSENNLLMNRYSSFELHNEKGFFDTHSLSSKHKNINSTDLKINASKFQAIMDDARSSLTKEALDTINGMGQEANKNELLAEKAKI